MGNLQPDKESLACPKCGDPKRADKRYCAFHLLSYQGQVNRRLASEDKVNAYLADLYRSIEGHEDELVQHRTTVLQTIAYVGIKAGRVVPGFEKVGEVWNLLQASLTLDQLLDAVEKY